MREEFSLRFYTRRECPLCDEMERVIQALDWERIGVRAGGVNIERRDVDLDPSWVECYGLSVPVLEFEGRAIAKGRATAAEIEGRLARRLGTGEGD